MKRVRIITNNPSEGALNLRGKLTTLGVDANVYRNDKSGTPLRDRVLSVKWGSFPIAASRFQHIPGHVILNEASSDRCLNKLTALQVLQEAGVPVPEFTSSNNLVLDWLTEGERVYARKKLRSSAGEGIEVLEGNDNIPNAPLYTKGLKGKRREYRIHVFSVGDVKRIFIQQKLRRRDYEQNPNYSNTVRNLEAGWIFAHNPENIKQPRPATIDAAVATIAAFGLNFGAVDVIEMDAAAKGSYVLEVNTAPGLQGATCDFYAEAIKAVAQQEGN